MAPQVAQLRWMATHYPDEPAYVDLASGEELTFAAWDHDSNRLARGLVAAGVAMGDRVALHLENHHVLRWVVGYAAIHKAGAVAVPTNVRLAGPELAHILGHAEPVAAITSAALRPAVTGACPGLGAVVDAGDDRAWSAALHADASPFAVEVDDGDLADILYTSGTTGLPKGIAARHRDTHVIPNGEPAWTGDAWIHASPLSTFAGLTFVYNPMKMGMRALYLPRFDVGAWLAAVAERRPTMAFLVPAMVALLVADDHFAATDLSSLTMVSIGSAPLAPALHQAMADRLPGAMVTNNYSMSESGSAFTYLPPGELARRPGSVGIPVPPTEIRIAGGDGAERAAGQTGEVLIKVGHQHREYYKDPGATAAAFTAEGWLRTGDRGHLDADGYLYISGRHKDLIIRGGNNIAATEVEAVLYQHPGVLEAAVVGVPHDVLGEDVGAAVVAKPGSDLDLDDLGAFCADRLADYKVPRQLWSCDELPRNANGKVLKQEIRVPLT